MRGSCSNFSAAAGCTTISTPSSRSIARWPRRMAVRFRVGNTTRARRGVARSVAVHRHREPVARRGLRAPRPDGAARRSSRARCCRSVSASASTPRCSRWRRSCSSASPSVARPGIHRRGAARRQQRRAPDRLRRRAAERHVPGRRRRERRDFMNWSDGARRTASSASSPARTTSPRWASRWRSAAASCRGSRDVVVLASRFWRTALQRRSVHRRQGDPCSKAGPTPSSGILPPTHRTLIGLRVLAGRVRPDLRRQTMLAIYATAEAGDHHCRGACGARRRRPSGSTRPSRRSFKYADEHHRDAARRLRRALVRADDDDHRRCSSWCCWRSSGWCCSSRA